MKYSKLRRNISDFVRAKLYNQKRATEIQRSFALADDQSMEKLLKEREELTLKVSKMWRDKGLSAVITPIWPHAAFKMSNAAEMMELNTFAHLWSVTGFPAGVLPITKVNEDEQTYTDSSNDSWT